MIVAVLLVMLLPAYSVVVVVALFYIDMIRSALAHKVVVGCATSSKVHSGRDTVWGDSTFEAKIRCDCNHASAIT